MANIKDKIKKLLSLATSPNENEARAALLKAKKLMMEHKLSERDIKEENMELIHMQVDGVKWTTDSGDTWVTELSRIIADNYMCVTAWSHVKGRRTYTLEVTGMGDDVQVCASAIEYAVGCVRSGAKLIARKFGGDERNTRHSYAMGFIIGLEVAFENQREEHQEWGLVELKPKEVREYESTLGTRNVKAKMSKSVDALAYLKGTQDGENFNTRRVIENV